MLSNNTKTAMCGSSHDSLFRKLFSEKVAQRVHIAFVRIEIPFVQIT